MKKISRILIAVVVAAGLWSCEGEDNFMIAEQQPVDFAIITPDNGTTIILAEETAPLNNAVTFTWEDMDYGTPTEITYTVQFAKNGTDFADAMELTSSTARNYSITVGQLNTIALNYFSSEDGFEEGYAGTIDVRIKSTIGTTGSDPKYSNVVSIVVVPFIPTPTVAPKLYVVGSFQTASGYGSDWTPANAVPLEAASPTSTNYEGYVYFSDASSMYKFLPTNASFDGDYGDTGAADGAYSQTLEQDGEVNAGLPSTGAGYYLVKADLGALTYSLSKMSWGILGSATPTAWDSDTDLTYDPATKKFTIVMSLSDGAIKFRANDGWDTNLGDTGADGTLEYGGSDIMVTSGTYTIVLDLSVPRHYTYTLTEN